MSFVLVSKKLLIKNSYLGNGQVVEMVADNENVKGRVIIINGVHFLAVHHMQDGRAEVFGDVFVDLVPEFYILDADRRCFSGSQSQVGFSRYLVEIVVGSEVIPLFRSVGLKRRSDLSIHRTLGLKIKENGSAPPRQYKRV